MTIAGLIAAVSSHLAGHAPSWRSLSVVALQSLPLLPGITLFWRLMEWLRARYTAVPLMLWLGLAVIGTIAAMLVSSGLVFAVHNRALAFAEDHDGDMKLVHHLMGTAGALYLYGTTAFRLWWPWGGIIPATVAILFWRAHKR